MIALLLISLAPVLCQGYRLGAGNQGIQIAFLEHAINGKLFATDPMVQQTSGAYPTFFFALLGKAVGVDQIPLAYFALHLLTSFALTLAVFGLARAMFADKAAAWVAVLLLAAGHQAALGGDDLYSPAFTHTWAVFPIAIAALMLAYRGWLVAAFALAGIVWNFHALTGAYLAAMLGAVAVAQWRWRSLIGPIVFALIALPAAWLMWHGPHGGFDEQWMDLTRLRSAEHSFPFSWWRAGDGDLPRFAALIGLAAVAMSFETRPRTRRTTALLAAAVGIMLLVGVIFTEWLPMELVVRAQLFRCTRLVMVIALCHIAGGIVGGWRECKLEAVLAILTAACVAAPALAGWLPIALALAVGVSLWHGRLSWVQAMVAGAALLVCGAAWRYIALPLAPLPHFHLDWTWLAVMVIAAVLLAMRRWRIAGIAAVICYGVGAGWIWHSNAQAQQADDWVQAQLWARAHTPADALFLTPPQPGGFRLFSQRAIVGEWRDGTQAYFSSAFGKTWLATMDSLRQVDDASLQRLSEQNHARYIVLPRDGTEHSFHEVYSNSHWAIYDTDPLTAATQPSTRPGLSPPQIAQAKFMKEVVYPNIEKYRKSDVKLRLLDENGRPLVDAKYNIEQTRQAFDFGCSMAFFSNPPPVAGGSGDFRPPPVTDAEKNYLPQIFNASLIAFSGKWMYLEPREGERHYEDLDAYVNWCTAHHIDMEFHFVSGYEPDWLRKKTPEQKQAAFLRHATDLVLRYGTRIKYWQVVNEQHLLTFSPLVFEWMRMLQPGIQLGISNCAQFYDPQIRNERENPLFRGLADVKYVQQQGVPVDFFAFHGHRPFGVWPEAKQMYQALDGFAKAGVRVHISEFSCPLNHPILGNLKHGTWTPELQAEFYDYFYTVCFSHPDVDMINLWGMGPVTWQSDAGLLDEKSQPKPVFERLQHLIRDQWMTRLEGTVPLDGALAFRGFQGDYRITVTLPNGQTAQGAFSVRPGQTTSLRFKPVGQNLTIE